MSYKRQYRNAKIITCSQIGPPCSTEISRRNVKSSDYVYLFPSAWAGYKSSRSYRFEVSTYSMVDTRNYQCMVLLSFFPQK
jgi:hypothetical protein